MDCRVLRALTIKSNGRLSCDDSAGYQIDIGEISGSRHWSLRRVLSAPIYQHIRGSFARDEMPWPGACPGCDLLSRDKPADDRLDSEITLQVEPTLRCKLRCPSCHRPEETLLRPGGMLLDPALYVAFVRKAVEEGIRVSQIEYLGWGEPFDHPEIGAFLEGVNAVSPETHQTITTHGNHDYAKVRGRGRIDTLVVSCDGVEQEGYVAYRRNGHVDKALQFLRDAAAPHPERARHVQWKYILFNFNDTEAEVARAQQIAEEAGVDDLQFIVTNSPEGSDRVTPQTLRHFPLTAPMARIDLAAALHRDDRKIGGIAVVPGVGDPQVRLLIDRATQRGDRLWLEGWAAGPSGAPVDGVSVRTADGAFRSLRVIREHRRDLVDAGQATLRAGLRLALDLEELGPIIALGLTAEGAPETVFDLVLPGDVEAAFGRPGQDIAPPPGVEAGHGGVHVWIDRVTLCGDRMFVEGWAAGPDGTPVERIDMIGGSHGKVPIAFQRRHRSDVLAVHDGFRDDAVGFRLVLGLRDDDQPVRLGFAVGTAGAVLEIPLDAMPAPVQVQAAE